MVQGLGKLQREQHLKTESKIVAFLNLQPFLFNELHSISGIRRNSLRDSLDSLINRKIVVKRKHNPTTTKYPTIGSKYYKVRRGIYYSLNLSNAESKRLVSLYYEDQESKPPITKELKKELLSSIDQFRTKIENENDDIIEQIAIFKKEIEPFVNIDKPDNTMRLWLDCIALFRRNRQLMTKMLKIFMIKMRIKLDYVDIWQG